MSGFVCDLYFFEPGTAITAASGPSSPDGAVDVSVLAPTGTPLFAINSDPPYASRTNTTGTFTGLVPGSYVINARISDNCVRELTVIIPFVEVWNPKYRLQYGTITESGLSHRFDIEELGYLGGITYPEADEEPVNVEARNEGGVDPFTPVIGTGATVTLNSRTDDEFSEFETFSERKYRGSWYVNGVLKYQGFMIPMNNEAPYNWHTNYNVTLSFTDGLEDLSTKPFSDNFGNAPQTRISVMDGIVFCLQKTGISLPIHETINIYPLGASVGSPTRSILDQIYFDPLLFKQADGTMEDCKTVLSELMRSLAGRIHQANGVWNVESHTLKTGPTTKVRILTADGADNTSANTDFRIRLRSAQALAPKITFAEQSAYKSSAPMYGELEFIQDYGVEEENNLLLNGTFEDVDIINGQLEGWQIDNTDAPNVVCTIEDIPNRENSRKALKIPFDVEDGITNDQVIILRSQPIALEASADQYDLHFSFDILANVLPISTQRYAFIDYSIAFEGVSDTYYMNIPTEADGATGLGPTSGPLDTLLDGIYLRSYIDEPDQWKTFPVRIRVNPANLGGPFACNMQITFRISCNPLYDVASISDLRGLSTITAADYPIRNFANRRRVKQQVVTDIYIHSYALEGTGQADDQPQIIEPDDDAVTNRWILKTSLVNPATQYESWVSYFLIDNVQVAYLPSGEEPEQQASTLAVMSTDVKNKLTIPLRLGDLNADENYKNISRGWFSLDDGSPTTSWKINTITLPNTPIPLINMLTNLYRGQYQTLRRRLRGNVDCVEVLPYMSNTIYEVVTGKIYIMMANGMASRAALANIEILEALQGSPLPDDTPTPDPDVEPPPSIADFDSDDFDAGDFLTV